MADSKVSGLGAATELDSDDLLYAVEDGVSVKATVDQVAKAAGAAPSLMIYSPDPLRKAVEASSGGRATVHYTAKGQPSYFHIVPKFLCEDIAPGGEIGTGVHPAFLNGGVEESEIFVGMYQMSEVDGEGVSQPMAVPKVSINWDNSRALIQACGAGFDMMTVWDWAAVVLWSAANGYDVRGNTQYGRHHNNRWETGRRQDELAPGDTAGTDLANVLTGSGPNAWRHNNSPDGIADMVGNVWEWLLGMKMVDGRVFLADDNSIGNEATWADTGWDMTANGTWATQPNAGASDALKQALIVPNGALDPEGYEYLNLSGERFPLRGGYRYNASNAGPAALALYYARTDAYTVLGSRPRFRNP